MVVGKSKTKAGAGRTIKLNARILSVLAGWAEHFPNRKPSHYVFPFEKYGAKGKENRFGFTDGAVVYDTDPTRPIGDWKGAWEEAKIRAGRVLNEEMGHEKAEPLVCRFHDLRHTACTRMLENGTAFATVAVIMGWSPSAVPRMIKRYGHIGDQAQEDAVNSLGREPDVRYCKKSPKSVGEEYATTQ